MINLTTKDIELVVKQCGNQGVENQPEAVAGFALAYAHAKMYQGRRLPLDVVLHWARLVDERNEDGFRRVPVTFRSGGKALPANQIERAMERLEDGWHQGGPKISPEEIYREFQLIHPFIDGNGRVGHLIWAWLTQFDTGKWPEELPPEFWVVQSGGGATG